MSSAPNRELGMAGWLYVQSGVTNLSILTKEIESTLLLELISAKELTIYLYFSWNPSHCSDWEQIL